MSKPDLIRIFSGYDHREPLGYHVCTQSIMETTSLPFSLTPLKLSNLRSIFNRKREPQQVTDFSYTRFLVPYLCQYEGWALYMDGVDMLVREDLANLWALKDSSCSIMVVKHPEFQGKHTFLDTTIDSFPRFNWSSLMLFNNSKCTPLTPEYLSSAAYHDLHQFKWLDEKSTIGALPPKWNHLVGYYEPSKEVALVHWTQGGPFFGDEYENTEYAEEWFAMRDKADYVQKK